MDIWQEIRKDQECGAKRLVSEYGDRLFSTAALLCPNEADAEELVFRSFEQAIRKIHLYEPRGEFFSWLYTIMLNLRRMDLRKKRIELVPLGSLDELSRVSDPFVRTLVDSSGKNAIGKALGAISPLLREVITRHYFEGEPVAAIASSLNVSEGTVKSRLFNAREVLQELLSKGKRS